MSDPRDDDPRDNPRDDRSRDDERRDDDRPDNGPRDAGRRDDESVDAEFERLMSGLDLDAARDTAGAPQDVADASGTDPDTPSAAPPGGEVEDGDTGELTVAELFGAAEPSLTVLMTPVASARALAGALRLAGSVTRDGVPHELPEAARAVPTESGALVAADLTPADAENLAFVVSSVLSRTPVVLFSRRDDRMIAQRWAEGAAGDEIPPALVLGACPDVVEDLMIGAAALEDLEGTIEIASLTRLQALGMIARRKDR